MKEGGPFRNIPPEREDQKSPPGERHADEEKAKRTLMTRRGFMTGMAGAAAVGYGLSTVPQSVLDDLSRTLSSGPEEVSERERAIGATITAAQENLRRKDILRALNSRQGHDFLNVVRAVELPILPEHLEGTAYDVRELHRRYPFVLKNDIGGRRVGVGNAIHWGRDDVLLTPAHVAYTGSHREKRPVPDIDLELLRVDPKKSPDMIARRSEEVIRDNPALTNADLHGTFAVVVGTDPDEPNALSGYGAPKTYAGILVKMSPNLAHARFPFIKPPIEKKTMTNSFMLILPPGEARSRSVPRSSAELGPRDARDVRASGMSGGKTFVFINGRYEYAGALWSVAATHDYGRKRTVDTGFIHGIDEVRRVAEARAERLR